MKRAPHPTEDLRLEAVIVSTNFDDVLAQTLPENLPNLDTLIVVTANGDKATQKLCKKLCVTCVQTDLFHLDHGVFNKGAAINAGFDHFRFFGWRLHMDSDILLPRDFRRLLFNACELDPKCVYGADRVDMDPGETEVETKVGCRNVDLIRGWVPFGYFQLWHASQQKAYPHSLGNGAHDDDAFTAMWPGPNRILLPEVIVHHLGRVHSQFYERTITRNP